MGRLLATVSLAVLAIAGALPEALAYLKAGPPMAGPGHHRLKVPGGAPLDGFTQPSAAYSFRKLSSSYAGFAMKLRRADTATQDIGFVGFVPGLGSPFDVAAANAFCTTTCTLDTWYIQAGTAGNLVQATAANQLAYIPNCIGTKPCFEITTSTQSALAAVNITPATGVVSFAAFANRVAGTGVCTWMRENGNANRFITRNAVANQWTIGGGTSGLVNGPTAPDNAWHAGAAVLNGAASLVAIDGVDGTPAAAVGNTAAGSMGVLGIVGTTCRITEAMSWDAYATTPAERVALSANQLGYYQ